MDPISLVFHGCWSSWSLWNEWSFCAASTVHKCIGEQKRQRDRQCNNPKPSKDGKHCPDSNKQDDKKYCLLKEAAGHYTLFLGHIIITPTFSTISYLSFPKYCF